MNQIEFIVLLAALLIVIVLQLIALLRARGGADAGLAERIERVEREVRMQLQATAQASRQETAQHLSQAHAATVQQFDAMRRQLETQGQTGREEQSQNLKRFADAMSQTLSGMAESNGKIGRAS